MRNQLLRAPIIFLLCYSIIFCTNCGEFPTIYLTSKFQRQIKQEEFERIYNESSLNMRQSIGKQEFIDKLKNAVKAMKKADPELNWQNSRANFDSYGRAEGELKYYNAQRVLGSDTRGVYVSLQFIEETGGVAKLDSITVQDFTTEPTSTISIP